MNFLKKNHSLPDFGVKLKKSNKLFVSKTKLKLVVTSIIVLCVVFSCNKGPKVISKSTGTESSEKSTGVFSGEPSTESNSNGNQTFADDLHTVVVNEVLPTSRYAYLNVKEGEKRFWIATRSQNIEKGKRYFYKGGLLKTRFESKEYNRVFDTIYLVSNLVEENHSNNAGSLNKSKAKPTENSTAKVVIPTHTEEIIEHKGSIKIAELVKDPKKYEGKTIQISGKCVKVNPGIMERNWIHLKDGSKDDFDLVVTSDTFVPEGTVITVKALVSLNKDFGAGYNYDLILENGLVTIK